MPAGGGAAPPHNWAAPPMTTSSLLDINNMMRISSNSLCTHPPTHPPTSYACLPAQVFDDNRSFSEWFGTFLGSGALEDDSALSREKRLVVVHRLHQILEPFMLRRMVRLLLFACWWGGGGRGRHWPEGGWTGMVHTAP